ncbi:MULTISPECIES: MOSC domain-containing protein [Brevibacterium]|uniref:MOSC domain-containing protein n=1 Tax=Brevibacterium salitolerans TaxID=1403566 RepID=A0ABN2WF35_9MICO|nr:2Fe-2S iron-sulfur cluster-binding protein [Brevibacterium sp.]
MIAEVRSLHRFPVKGFPAETLSSARVAPGAGIAGDRVLALADGTTPVASGEWRSWSAFLALKKRSDLAAWTVETLPGGHIRLTPPAADTSAPASPTTFTLRPEAAPAAELAALLPGTSPQDLAFTTASTAAAPQGMFDDREGHLSLISLASVRTLAEATGTDIDPLRFRGNLLLEGLAPFAEFGLVGRTVRIGGAVVFIRSTIERCAATKVDPRTARSDLNVPRLLSTAVGHIHMGVYGTVLSPGRIAAGDGIELLDGASPRPLPAGTGPRLLRVQDSATLEPGRHHLRLHDPYGWFAAHWRPGMHVRVHLAGAHGPLWRTYTACLVRGSEFSLLVEERGEVSAALAALRQGDSLLVSGPFGSATPESVLAAARTDRTAGTETVTEACGSPRIAVLTAGIGLTTALSLLPELAAGAQVRCLHIDRGLSRASVESLTRLTDAPVDLWDTAVRGRPTGTELTAFLAGASAAVLCGGESFVAAARAAARAAGLPAAAVVSESFASPVSDTGERLAGRPPAVLVRADGRRLGWEPEDGTLLEALEADGARIPFTCRSGSCGTCAIRVGGPGVIEHVLDHTAEPAPGSALSCCAVPVGEVHVGV